MIPDRVVEEVRARADIVGIIGEFVQLRKAGSEFKGLSPFNEEKTPSFFVNPSKNSFHDFSADVHGDVFKFLMKHQGMSFVDAVKYAGARSGVEVREVRSRNPEEDVRRPYYEAVAFARDFFSERLWEWDGGRSARDYLEGRGIDRDTGEQFGIGFAPDDWRAFCEAAAVHGMEESILLELGLVKKSDGSDRPYDAFRNRVIFPIESIAGRTIGFGGRLLGREGRGAPKYLNSPESPVFEKGAELYGLRWARNHIRREGAALLVEGFMDAVSLAAVGIRHAVATQGTALTERHARLLGTCTQQVRIIFDSDPAGLRATFRAADILLAHGIQASVVTLPDGEDPDSVARQEGAEGVLLYIGQAVDVLERKIAILEERDYFGSIEGTRTALDRLLPTLRAVRDDALRDIYLDRVAGRTGITVASLAKELDAGPAPPRPRVQAGRSRSPTAANPRFHGLGPDRQLILLLLQNRALVELAGERIGAEDLEDRACRAIFEELIHDPGLVTLPEGAAPDVVRRFDELMMDNERLTMDDGTQGDDAADGEARARVAAAFEDTMEWILNSVKKKEIDARAASRAEASPTEVEASVKDETRLRREMSERRSDWRVAARYLAGVESQQAGRPPEGAGRPSQSANRPRKRTRRP